MAALKFFETLFFRHNFRQDMANENTRQQGKPYIGRPVFNHGDLRLVSPLSVNALVGFNATKGLSIEWSDAKFQKKNLMRILLWLAHRPIKPAIILEGVGVGEYQLAVYHGVSGQIYPRIR